MPVKEILRQLKEHFSRRKFAAGLLVSMIDMLLDLEVPEKPEIQGFDDLLKVYPKRETTAAGGRANTLILQTKNGTVSLRPFYNSIENRFRADEKRFDYPSCAPHATQAWGDYTEWIDALCRLSRKDLQRLKHQVIEYVLEQLPSQEFIPGSIKVAPPVFRLLLEGFDFVSPRGEPSGAAFQGAIFGFIRADNPHLQVEIDKVRTGSKRRNRIGDIDAWDGERLAITAEVKNFVLRNEDVDSLTAFAAEANRRGAIGVVVAQSISEDARTGLMELGIRPLTTEHLIAIVDLWDPAKQRIAVESMVYYATHVEQKSVLQKRLKGFLDVIDPITGA